MQTEYVLYATKIGAENWEEEIIAVDTKPLASKAQLEEVKQILATKGFDRVRVAAIDLSIPPNFAKTLNL